MPDDRAEGAYGINIGTLAEGRAYIGRPTEPRFADDAVNTALSRRFAASVQDGNPLFWDDDFAQGAVGSPVAPPATLVAWVTPLDWRPDGSGGPGGALLTAVPMPGNSMINVSSEIEFFDYLRVGDRLNVVEEVESISDEKVTQAGRGHFISMVARFRRESGELVARQHNVMLRFWAEDTQ
jgi:acyl dehydratase